MKSKDIVEKGFLCKSISFSINVIHLLKVTVHENRTGIKVCVKRRIKIYSKTCNVLVELTWPYNASEKQLLPIIISRGPPFLERKNVCARQSSHY